PLPLLYTSPEKNRKRKSTPARNMCCPSNFSPSFPKLLCFIHLCQLRRLICCYKAVDNLIQISVQHLSQTVGRQLDSVIRHTALGKVVGSDLFRPVSGSHLAFPYLRLR